MSTTQNMSIWKQVCHTNPEFTKKANNGKFEFTCIDPQYQTEQATALWGPYGGRWGMRNLRFTTLVFGEVPNMMLQAEFFYPDGAFDIAVDMKYRPGGDTCKCLQTSAKSKALSYLGFGADVFMGMFDDVSYVKMQEIKHKDSDVVRKEMLARVKSATSVEKLETQRLKLLEMYADDIVSQSVFAEVSAAIESRLNEFVNP